MGAWAEDSFGNDTACDWAYKLEDADDLSIVITALQAIVDEESYLESDLACEAIAACEVVARLKGNWGIRNPYSETVDKWVESHPISPTHEVVALSEQALERILGKQSELRELWDETGDDAWRNAVEDLRRRIVS